MNEFFENVKKSVVRGSKIVVQKSGEVVETSKYSIAVSALKSDVEREYQKMGQMLYDGYKADNIDTEKINSCCETVDIKYAEIENLTNKINSLKKIKICTQCGEEIPAFADFCPKCGVKL